MNRREVILAGAAIAGATAIGAIAFTTGSVEREISIDIASDDEAIIGLAPGMTDAVEIVDGVLTIDTGTAESEGLNPDGEFVYGDPDAPTDLFAFSVTNNDDNEREFTFGLDDFELGGEAELRFPVYDADGQLVGDLTPEANQSVTLESTEMVYVHMVINSAGLDEDDDMGGTLTIDVR